jgi:hypothetical protein
MTRAIPIVILFAALVFYVGHYILPNMDTITDISPWRVTPDNPPLNTNELDHDHCATLHNFIVELGWIGSGRRPADLDRRTWWEFHGAAAEEARPRLAPSVIKFLEKAQIGSADRD